MEELSGVMALPEAQGPMGMAPEQAAIFEQIRQSVPRQEITQELLAAGAEADPQAVAEFKQELAGLELTPDELNKLNTMVDAILAAPQDYASLRRAYLAEGMPEDLLPEQFDPAFFAALNMAIDTIAMNPAPRPPMQMAMGGVASLAAYGRNGDTMLAHITPQEAAMLKRMGGSGTINPYTGLPEYGNVFSSIGKAVKKFAKSTVGKIVIGVGLAMLGAPVAGFLGGAASGAGLSGIAGFLSSTAGQFAVGGFLSGAGTTLASGGKIKDALKAGLFGAVTGAVTAGVTQGGAAAFAPKVASEAAATSVASDLIAQAGQPLDPILADTVLGSVAGPDTFSSSVVPRSAPVVPALSSAPPVVPTAAGPANFDYVSGAPISAPVSQGPTGYDVLPRMGVDTSFSSSATSVQPPPSSGGVMDTLKDYYGKAEGFYDKYISPERYANDPNVLNAQKDAAMKAGIRADELGLSAAAKDRFVSQAIEKATPGMLMRYAPLAALGVGALGAMGGFKAEQPQMPDMFKGPTGYQLYLQNPAMYGLYYGGTRPTSYGGSYLRGYAEGGGVMDTPQAMRVGGKTYPRKTGPINGPGTGTSDSIPAMLSDGEFVFTAKAVRAMGNGSRRKGAKKMYKLMKMLEGKAA